MRIALDATPLSVRTPGGIRRYTGELGPALAREFPDDEFWMLSDKPFGCVGGGLGNLRCGRAPASALERRWWSWGLRREISRIGADVFHGTDFAVPYQGACPSVMTVHDLSPWRPSLADETSARVRRRAAALLRLRRPAMVITPTNAIRSEFLERFNYSHDRVVTVPLAASAAFRPVASNPQRSYFLHVGAIQNRKNAAVIVDAWRDLRRTRDIDLVLAGAVRNSEACPAPEPGLTLLHEESDAALAALYSGAIACLIPSHYEGFGIPMLEAMQCGCPVAASRDAALLEVSGGAAEHAEATDGRAWRTVLDRLLVDEQFRAGMRARALARAAEFSWTRTARLTREVYAAAMAR